MGLGCLPPRTRPRHDRFRGNLCAAHPKVACNSAGQICLITQKHWNHNETISIPKRLIGKFHATLLGNHDDAPYDLRPRPGQVVRLCTRYGAVHPLRGSAPVTGQCTRSERVQCLRIGCTTPVTSPHADLPEWRSTDPTGAGHRDGRARRDFKTTHRAGGSRRVACAAPNPSAAHAYDEAGAGHAIPRSRAPASFSTIRPSDPP